MFSVDGLKGTGVNVRRRLTIVAIPDFKKGIEEFLKPPLPQPEQGMASARDV
jgi:hypothetical protein